MAARDSESEVTLASCRQRREGCQRHTQSEGGARPHLPQGTGAPLVWRCHKRRATPEQCSVHHTTSLLKHWQWLACRGTTHWSQFSTCNTTDFLCTTAHVACACTVYQPHYMPSSALCVCVCVCVCVLGCVCVCKGVYVWVALPHKRTYTA